MVRAIATAFNGGEMSPQMLGRLDDPVYRSGAERLRNFFSLPQGGARRRPGMRYVAQRKYSNRISRLFEFRYSIDQTFAVEFGHQYFRFHASGAPVVWANMREVAAVSTTSNRLTFVAPHGFSQDDQVTITVTAGGSVPTGLTYGTTYFVRVVDAKTIELSATMGGAAIDITGAGSGTFRVGLVSEIPRQYVISKHFTTDFATNNNLTFSGGHQFVADDPILITANVGGTIPAPLEEGVVYYALIVDGDNIRLSLTPGGTEITLTSNGTGTGADANYDYHAGDSVFWKGTGFGVFVCLQDMPLDNAPPAATTYWYRQDDAGAIEIPHVYDEDELRAVTYSQRNNVTMTFAHPEHQLATLVRVGSDKWHFSLYGLSATVDPPANVFLTPNRGQGVNITAVTALSPATFQTAAPHTLFAGDIAWIENFGSNGISFGTGNYIVADTPTTTTFRVLNVNDGQYATASGTYSTPPFGIFYYTSLSAQTSQSYVVTSVDAQGRESLPSPPGTTTNVLVAPGSSNLLTWVLIDGAETYYVYKLQNGVYGYIGQSDNGGFVDENYGPDLSRTPPFANDLINSTTDQYPAAVAHYQQRMVLADTNAMPETCWLSRTADVGNFSYRIPVQADDRIKFQLQASELQSIRHIVPLSDLLLFTASAEWSIRASSNDALAPDNVRAVTEGYNGSSQVRPVVADNVVLYVAAVGNHLRQAAYSLQAQGFRSDDICYRAAHLFDGQTIVDLAYQRAPYPIIWAVDDMGRLVSCTYAPYDSITAWHVQETDGVCESIVVLQEGVQQSVYVSVARTIGGETVRTVERMTDFLVPDDLDDRIYVDSALQYDGRNTSATTIMVSAGRTWAAGDSVTITSSSVLFAGVSDIGDRIHLTASDGTEAIVSIVGSTSATVMSGRLVTALPESLRATATTSWGFARRSFPGLGHLDGATVQIVADGAVLDAQEVVDGSIELETPAVRVMAGVGYTSTLRTLPVSLQLDGSAGIGTKKNVVSAWIRTVHREGLRVAADDESVPVYVLEERAVMNGTWNEDGQVTVTQSEPLPAEVSMIAIEIATGGV